MSVNTQSNFQLIRFLIADYPPIGVNQVLYVKYTEDIQSATISPFSPQYVNGYPPNFGVLPAGPGAAVTRKPYVTIAVVCRT